MELLQSLLDKKYKKKWNYLTIGLLILVPKMVFAGSNLILVYPGDLIYEGPADQIRIGDPIGATWIATGDEMMCDRRPIQDIATAHISAISPSTGQTTMLDGVSYDIFDTGTPGIGWVMSVKDTNAYNFTPLLDTENQWYPASGTQTNQRVTIGGAVKVTYIKTQDRLVTGVTSISAQNLAKISCDNAQGQEVDTAFIYTPSKQIRVTARACTVDTPKNDIVQMGNFNSIDLPQVGDLAGNKTYNIILNCDPNIQLYATLSDQSNLSNRTNKISLSPDSTADGVEVQVSYNGSVLSLGPDSTGAGADNQFKIRETGTGGVSTVPLTFNYIRTGALQAGSANALVSVTFSYQ